MCQYVSILSDSVFMGKHVITIKLGNPGMVIQQSTNFTIIKLIDLNFKEFLGRTN